MTPTFHDIGKLVRYYDEGWRYGRLEEIVARIRPVAPKNARVREIYINNIELEEQCQKENQDTPSVATEHSSQESVNPIVQTMKKRRGRPKKNSL